ncbi:LysM peptidoglycan-binding domain-containing protein [Alicyclobacillus macrosporangiidus]|uniref:LysM domain-containing protein n=1 Tax=Alicyclobacillus macrosporangiidus TaxID=392015 RepID=A0A1I7JVF9_9BACL|nr:LysM peptidoglycan-binding domain-containing protein [Alicyclobacillus macrosporangiidus]SFU89202.1 LysM domain-containing protein [Alicyclobacillus macrosporangiidus]
MSDTERAPVIRLNVDQEVFIPAVREGDRVEDATVATEVTSFDRVGDAYVLEGAIVFAGYLTRPGTQTPAEEDSFSLDFGDPAIGQHVHHRMPFVLRVPVKVQPRGLVNVASRITHWQLDVVGPGWVRVLADLSIVGLNGQQGYHFQCGAQEAGDVFFDSASAEPDAAPEGEAASGGADANPDATPYALARGSGRGRADDIQSAVRQADDSSRAAMEAISGARQGAGPADPPEVGNEADLASDAADAWDEPDDRDADVLGAEARRTEEPGAKEQLAGFDRLIDGAANWAQAEEDAGDPDDVLPADAREDQENPYAGTGASAWPVPDVSFRSAEPWPDVARSAPAEGASGLGWTRDDGFLDRPWTEMEFEHQLQPDDLHEAAGSGSPAPEERFVPSRGFSGGGFQATAGFVQTPASDAAPPGAPASSPVESHSAHGLGAVDVPADASGADRGEVVPTVDNSLWSFVDFNAPERTYTLRFAIVMEDESLESVAERLGVTTAELMRVNRLTSDTVYAGQCLRVPVPAGVR